MTSTTTTTDRRAEANRPAIVKNAASSHFSVVDLAAGTVIAEVGEGRYPHTVLYHPSEPIAYLLYISSAHLEVLDLETLETRQRIDDLGTAPVGSTIGPDTEYLFVGTAVETPSSDDPGIIALSITADGRLEHAGERPLSRCSGMRIGPDDRLYAGLKNEAAVAAITPDAELTVEDRIPTGEKPHDMYVLDESGYIVVNNAGESFASFLDPRAGRVQCTAETGANPHGFAVARSDDYHYGIFPSRDDAQVAVVDLEAVDAGADNPTKALIDVGVSTGFAGVLPDGRYVLVDSYDDAYVRILDLAELSMVGRVQVGGEPLHVVVDPDGERCYVGNMARNDLAVLDTAPLLDGRPGDVTVERRVEGLGEKPSGIFLDGDGA